MQIRNGCQNSYNLSQLAEYANRNWVTAARGPDLSSVWLIVSSTPWSCVISSQAEFNMACQYRSNARHVFVYVSFTLMVAALALSDEWQHPVNEHFSSLDCSEWTNFIVACNKVIVVYLMIEISFASPLISWYWVLSTSRGDSTVEKFLISHLHGSVCSC